MLKANADTIYMYNRRVGGVVINFMLFKEQGRARGGYSHTLTIRVCTTAQGMVFRPSSLEQGK